MTFNQTSCLCLVVSRLRVRYAPENEMNERVFTDTAKEKAQRPPHIKENEIEVILANSSCTECITAPETQPEKCFKSYCR